MQIYQWFKFNEQKVESHHIKNYNGEIITPLPKKWINNHKHQTCDTTTHYDMIDNAICKTKVITTYKLLWLSVSYLTHQEMNYLRYLQRWFQCHGKLLPKEKLN